MWLCSPPTTGFPHMQIQVNSSNQNEISARSWTWTLQTCSRGSDCGQRARLNQHSHLPTVYPQSTAVCLHKSTASHTQIHCTDGKKPSRNLLKHTDTNQQAKDSMHLDLPPSTAEGFSYQSCWNSSGSQGFPCVCISVDTALQSTSKLERRV